jgi:solute:Na+ symporter, SSS family
MNYLSWADGAIIAGYLLGVIAVGVWFGKGLHNTRDYFLGNRNIPWWGVGLSIVATETSALTFIGIPALAYGGTLAFIQIITGYVIARIILAVVLVPHYFKGEIYSPYQLFSNAFGPAARKTAGGFFLISGVLAAGVRVYVTCIPVQLMLGIDASWAILLFVSLSLIYTYVGGIKAVIWTDAIQFLLLCFGGIFTLLYIPSLIDGGFGTVLQQAKEAGKLDWFNPEFSLSMPFNIWMGLIGATIMVMSSHGADQLIVQRVLTCKSVREGRKALVLSAVIIFPLFLIFLFLGVFLWVFFQQTPMAIPLPTGREGFQQNDYIFPIFILTEIPAVVKGFLVVGILAAAMSSVSSALSALASVFTMDFIREIVRGRSEREYFRFSKFSTLLWGGLLVCVAYLSQQTASVLTLAFSLGGLTNGAMLGGLILALTLRRGQAFPIICGMVTSLLVMLGIHFIPRSAWKEIWMEHVGVIIAWPWYTLIGTAITLLVALLVRAVFERGNPAPPQNQRPEVEEIRPGEKRH